MKIAVFKNYALTGVSTLLLLADLHPAGSGDKGEPRQSWISLFNGRDLEGWIPKFTGHEVNENYKNTFRVEDGLLKVSYDQYDRFHGEFGHLFYKRKFSHYRIRVEYRFTGTQITGGPSWGLLNSGIMIHCQPPESMRIDQEFPVSIEVQLLGDDGTGTRTTGNVCTPGTNIVMDGRLITEHCTITSKQSIPVNTWATMEAEVHGSGNITHIVNGEVVAEYENPQLDLRDPDARRLAGSAGLLLEEGYISLQAETHPVEFRKVEILILEEGGGGK